MNTHTHTVKQSLQAATGREDSDGVPGDGVRGGRCEGVEEEEDSSDSEVVGPPLPPGYQVCHLAGRVVLYEQAC